MTSQLTPAEHYATQSAWRRHDGLCAQAAANWAVVLEYVQQHPGVSIQELAPMLAQDERITWSRMVKSLKAKLSFGRNVDGAMGRAGIRSRKVGRTIRLYTEADLSVFAGER